MKTVGNISGAIFLILVVLVMGISIPRIREGMEQRATREVMRLSSINYNYALQLYARYEKEKPMIMRLSKRSSLEYGLARQIRHRLNKIEKFQTDYGFDKMLAYEHSFQSAMDGKNPELYQQWLKNLRRDYDYLSDLYEKEKSGLNSGVAL